MTVDSEVRLIEVYGAYFQVSAYRIAASVKDFLDPLSFLVHLE